MICIWDKKNEKEIPKLLIDLAIGADGKVYRYIVKSNNDKTWLSREDVSDRYEVRYHLDIPSLLNR